MVNSDPSTGTEIFLNEFKNFRVRTTAHGMQKTTQGSLCHKLIWWILTIAALCSLLAAGYATLKEYQRSFVKTKISASISKELKLPSFAICNPKELTFRSDVYQEELLNLQGYVSNSKNISETCHKDFLWIFRKYKKKISTPNIVSVHIFQRNIPLHNIKSFTMRGSPCSVFTNNLKQFQKKLTSRNAILQSGYNIHLEENPKANLPNPVDFYVYKVYLSDGIYFEPRSRRFYSGVSSFIGLARTEINRVQPCMKVSQSLCLKNCVIRKVYQRMPCRLHTKLAQRFVDYQIVPDQDAQKPICFSCIESVRVIKKLYDAVSNMPPSKDCNQECYASCKKIKFDPQLSTAPVLPHFRQFENISKTYLSVFYAKTEVGSQTQSIESPLEFMTKLGGMAGLFIGGSIVTLLEIGTCLLTIFIKIFCLKYRGLKGNTSQCRTPSESIN